MGRYILTMILDALRDLPPHGQLVISWESRSDGLKIFAQNADGIGLYGFDINYIPLRLSLYKLFSEATEEGKH